jgi:hypothetical protein
MGRGGGHFLSTYFLTVKKKEGVIYFFPSFYLKSENENKKIANK